MKAAILILTGIFTIIFLTQCGSTRQTDGNAYRFEKKAPFTIRKAYYSDWVGGRPGSRGTSITIELAAPVADDIRVDSIFFKGKRSPINLADYDNTYRLEANFMASIVPGQDIIMHTDPKKEMANKVPDVPLSFPFKLADNECVISYFIKDKKYYYKVTTLQKEKTVFRP